MTLTPDTHRQPLWILLSSGGLCMRCEVPQVNISAGYSDRFTSICKEKRVAYRTCLSEMALGALILKENLGLKEHHGKNRCWHEAFLFSKCSSQWPDDRGGDRDTGTGLTCFFPMQWPIERGRDRYWHGAYLFSNAMAHWQRKRRRHWHEAYATHFPNADVVQMHLWPTEREKSKHLYCS